MLALLGKAQLKLENGYLEEAEALYQTAEQYAPTPDLKTEIQELAKNKLKNKRVTN